MRYFYCQSYQAFNLALQMNTHQEVTVVTCSENIAKAAQYLNISLLIHKAFTYPQLVRSKKSVLHEINRILSIIGESELHFSHTQFAVFLFLLINVAERQKRKLVFHNFEFVYNRKRFIFPSNRARLYLLFVKSWLEIRYRAPLEFGYSNPGTFMICLKKCFLTKTTIQLIEDKEAYFETTLEYFKELKVKQYEIQNLLIAVDFYNIEFFNITVVEDVLSLLNKENVYIKNHPKVEIKRTDLLNRMKVLPDFLPVELFFASVRGLVISFHSASLVTASKFDNLTAVSLLKIVGHDTEFRRKVMADLTLKSGARIVFPDTVEEFKLLLYAQLH